MNAKYLTDALSWIAGMDYYQVVLPQHERFSLVFPVSPTEHGNSLWVKLSRIEGFCRLLVPALELNWIPHSQLNALHNIGKKRVSRYFDVQLEVLLPTEHYAHFKHIQKLPTKSQIINHKS